MGFRKYAVAGLIALVLAVSFAFRWCHVRRRGAGLPDRAIVSVVVHLREDTRRRGEVMTAVADLLSVVGRDGTEASAVGRVRLYLDGGTAVHRGTRFTMRPRKIRRVDGECFLILTGEPPRDAVPPAGPWLAARARLLEKWRRLAAGEPVAGGLALALLTGVTDDMDTGLKDLFRLTGTLYFLALSGFHASLIILGVGGLLRPLTGNRWSLIPLLPVLLVYLFLAGARDSLLRAVLTSLLAGMARLLRVKVPSPVILSCAAVIHLLTDPWSLTRAGFQLSYLATAGILLLGPRFHWSVCGKLPGFLRIPLGVSLGAQTGTLVLQAALFGRLHPLGFLSALLLSPAVTLVFGAGLLWSAAALSGIAFVMPAAEGILRMAVRLLMTLAAPLTFLPTITFPPAAVGGHSLLLSPAPLILVLIPPRRPRLERPRPETQLRLPVGDKGPAGADGPGAPETLGTELPDQRGSPGEDPPAA